MVLALAASCFTQAYGAAELTIYDGVSPLIAVADNGPGDRLGATGAIVDQTNVGVWFVCVSTCLTKPIYGSTTDPTMELHVTASCTAAGSLRVVFSDNGFGPATGTLQTVLTGQPVLNSAGTLAYDVWGDPANVVGATTVHIAGGASPQLPPCQVASGTLALPAPFSLTQVLTLNALRPGTFTLSATFHVTRPAGSTVNSGSAAKTASAGQK